MCAAQGTFTILAEEIMEKITKFVFEINYIIIILLSLFSTSLSTMRTSYENSCSQRECACSEEISMLYIPSPGQLPVLIPIFYN